MRAYDSRSVEHRVALPSLALGPAIAVALVAASCARAVRPIGDAADASMDRAADVPDAGDGACGPGGLDVACAPPADSGVARESGMDARTPGRDCRGIVGDAGVGTVDASACTGFRAPELYAPVPDQYIAGIALGDFDNDCRTDVAVTEAYASRIALQLQSPTGGLGSPASYPTAQVNPAWMGSGDLDGDRRTDVVLAHQGYQQIGVFFQSEDGRLLPERLVPNPSGAADPLVADIDGDGAQDVIARNFGGFVVWHGRPDLPAPRLGPEQAFLADRQTASLALGDLDGDGRTDVAVIAGDYIATEAVYVFRQVAAGGFAPPDVTRHADIGGVAIADVTGDGRRDLVFGVHGALALLPQLPTGALGPMQQIRSASPLVTPSLIRAGDLNGDGLTDLAVLEAPREMGRIEVFLQRADGTLGSSSLLALPAPVLYFFDMLVGDVDDDGRADIVVPAGTGRGTNFVVLRQCP